MAAAMGAELRELKNQLEEGLLTEELYRQCVNEAVSRYTAKGGPHPPQPQQAEPAQAEPAQAAPAPAAQPQVQTPQQAQPVQRPERPQAHQGPLLEPKKEPMDGTPPQKASAAAPAAAARVSYPAQGGRGRRAGASGSGSAAAPHGAAAGGGGSGAVHSVAPKQVSKTWPRFDPKADRSREYSGPAGCELLQTLKNAVEGNSGEDLLLASVIFDLSNLDGGRKKYEEVLGALSPDAFQAFASAVREIRIFKEMKSGDYQPQWYVSLVK
eukprot:Rhum_TRINITY_DN11339_c0_g1::Rhum_TRINITY_DN11339_c0_g1_i1::g.44045::m.44045